VRRKVSASSFNAAIDVREVQPRLAMELLRGSASCCVLVATRCVLDGEPAALQQLGHDSVKRCMLGYRSALDIASEEHFVCTGLLILSALCRAAQVGHLLSSQLSFVAYFDMVISTLLISGTAELVAAESTCVVLVS
jgi:hypothetical protein